MAGQRDGEAQQGGVLRRLSFDQQGYGIAKHRDGSALIRYAAANKEGSGNMENVIKGILLALCGMGVGATAVWMALWRPKPIPEREARRRAEALYRRLMDERGWTE